MKYIALAFYKFFTIEKPHDFIHAHKKFFEEFDLKGRIYISEEGINAQMSGEMTETEAYRNWLKKDQRFENQYFNIQSCSEHAFPRMIVKYRRQLVALDRKIDVQNNTGIHLKPSDWSKMLEEEKNKIVLDVRNDYEWEIGHFEGASLPALSQFRDFPSYAETLKKEINPEETKVMMYCTGGIRCELYSALLKEKGFKHVYQLQGGVIRYGNEEGKKHWKGKLFVFDDRMAVPISDEESEILTHCHFCHKLSDTYYNCANMDCNHLFRSCKKCLAETKGCCSDTCQRAPRLRSYEREGNKPFRRKHLSEMCVSRQEGAFVSQEQER